MKRSRKSNRVSWAPGVKLCQVKVFLSEDCPARVGMESQVNHKVKTWSASHPRGIDANDLPPGFDHVKKLKAELCYIPQIAWKCPPKIVINSNWHVAAGEESEELKVQQLRELRVLEAVYPRLTAVPPSPSVSLDMKDACYDDNQTPVVPLTPIEDEEGADVPSEFSADIKASLKSQTPAVSRAPNTTYSSSPALALDPPVKTKLATGMLPGPCVNIMLAASTAVTAMMKSEEQESLIDTDLLVKILSDPKMVEKLVRGNGVPAKTVSAPANVMSAPSQQVTGPAPLSSQKLPTIMSANGNLKPVLSVVQPGSTMTAPQPDIIPVSMTSALRTTEGKVNIYPMKNQVQPALNANSVMAAQPESIQMVQPTIRTMQAEPNTVPGIAAATMKVNHVKDINYIKNLIRVHGREKQDNMEHNISQSGSYPNHIQNMQMVPSLKHGELKSKIRKPCIFFNSSRGCRNGNNCPYQHGTSLQLRTGSILEAPNAKRMKLGGEITGRT